MEVNLRIHRKKRARGRSGTGIKSGRVSRVAGGSTARGSRLDYSFSSSPLHVEHDTFPFGPRLFPLLLRASSTRVFLTPRPPFSLSFLDHPPRASRPRTCTHAQHACITQRRVVDDSNEIEIEIERRKKRGVEGRRNEHLARDEREKVRRVAR